MTLLTDALAATLLMAGMCLGVSVIVSGCINEPTFANRCDHCGEYLEDAEAVHEHFARCHPCR